MKLLLIAVFTLVLSLSQAAIKNKGINIVVKAPWPAFPLLPEASELVSSNSEESFWQFFEYLGVVSSTTDKENFDLAMTATSQLSSKSRLSLLKYALSIHQGSPKLAMYRQLEGQHLHLFGTSADIVKQAKAASSWVVFRGKIHLTTSSLLAAFSEKDQYEKRGPFDNPMEFDHVFPSSKSGEENVFLYGTIGDKKTNEFHTFLKGKLSEHKLVYIFRHHFPDALNNSTLNVQGFGVDLALKSLEYKVIDDTKKSGTQTDRDSDTGSSDELPIEGFDFVKLTKLHPELSTELMTFKAHLLSSQFDFDKLKVWQIKDLGLQTTQKILSSHEPLKALRDISQNLPILAHSLSSQPVNKTLRTDIESTIANLESIPENTIWINKLALDTTSLNPFEIYSILSDQIGNYEHLKRMHISPSDIFSVLTSKPESSGSGIRIFVHSDTIYYFNNLNKDSRYVQWNQGVKSVLRPLWPGQLHFIRSNLFNVVAVLDLGARNAIGSLQQLMQMVWQNIPARIGIMFDATDEISELALKTWNAVDTSHSRPTANFIQELASIVANGDNTSPRLTEDELKRAYQSATWSTNFDADVKNNPTHKTFVEKCKAAVKAKGLTGLGPKYFMNGRLLSISGDELFNSVVQSLYVVREEVQSLVKDGKITDETADPYLEVLKNGNDVLPSYNELIIPEKVSSAWYAPLFTEKAAKVVDNLQYIVAPQTEDQSKSITHLLAIHNNNQGHALLSEAIKHLQSGKEEDISKVMIGIIDCDGNSGKISEINKIVERNSKNVLEEISKIFENSNNHETNHVNEEHVRFCKEVLKLQAGSNAIVTNGRRIILPSEYSFSASHFQLLEKYEWGGRIKTVQNAIEQVTFDIPGEEVTVKFIANVVQKVSSLLSLRREGHSSQQQSIPLPTSEPSFSIVHEDPQIELVVVVNPLSATAQQLSPILLTLSQIFSVELKVYLKPLTSLSDMPLKNFFRYVVEPLSFDDSGKLNPGGVAHFVNLPQQRLLSTKIMTPDSWLVLSSSCVYDLDNIVLENLPDSQSVLHAEFTLENILLEGSCMDLSNRGFPPRGLELVLGDVVDPQLQDSLVMSNLGYFQLKSNPGVWNLSLASGQASAIYKTAGTDQEGQLIVIDSWQGQKHILRVEKRPGMESVSLFSDDAKQESNTLWSKAMNSVFGKKGNRDISSKNTTETIHIFSLASGHLYERFLKIMMFTAVNKTSAPVKFWLLSNFLSPEFKSTIPHLAEKFGFEVELVTYKWPSWLLHQTEKQRIIWGYKILFLDVLFPLHLKKVIYVDSDQVIKADLKELWNMDLHGAPYGYTPFCEGAIKNMDTAGFRFWDSGFWKNHLQGKPYHISALYVVDLQELRRRGYADVLRSTYDQLGRDPNSLANLDQDLPNYLQHMVPIFSLPEEWLWCSTWCTEESKSRAKTIDLCNNPLTKIPKLEAALQIIPEWPSLDAQIKQAELEIQTTGNVGKYELKEEL